jgi:hypothetical protein
MWSTAKRAHTQRAIFCGWWRNEFYAAPVDSPIYQTYWDGRFTAEERDWTRDIKALYDYDITPNQIAWWRWKTVEGLRDEALMYQEFPPTEDYAFIMTGTSFFSTARCTEEAKTAVKTRPDCYRYEFTTEFHQLTVAKTTERLATLKVWEEPVKDAYYVIGADPAYGSSDWADRFCISVFRCYADGLDQVAEFNTSECLPHQFAWVIAHLAGAYGNSVLNLEVNGPGQPTITELKRIKQKASMLEGAQGHELCNVLAGMSHYIWRKQDSMSGPTMSLGWLTTEGSKERMLAYFKDYFERGMMKVLSMELLEEMKTVMRHDGRLGAPGRGKDDRVIAAALACAAFSEQVQSSLIYAKKTRAESRVEIGKTAMEIGTNKSVSKWLKAIGIYADEGARR